MRVGGGLIGVLFLIIVLIVWFGTDRTGVDISQRGKAAPSVAIEDSSFGESHRKAVGTESRQNGVESSNDSATRNSAPGGPRVVVGGESAGQRVEAPGPRVPSSQIRAADVADTLPDSVPTPASDAPPNITPVLYRPKPTPYEGILYDSAYSNWFSVAGETRLPVEGEIARNAGTLALWIEPLWDAGNLDPATIVRIDENALRIAKEGDSLVLSVGESNRIAVNIADWESGFRHHVLATWDGSKAQFFLDGKLVGERDGAGVVAVSEEPKVHMGTPEGGTIPPGVLSHVQVFNRPLGVAEVETYYQLRRPRN